MNWSDDAIINLKSFESLMSGVKVTPLDPQKDPAGVQVIFDHQTFHDFRKEYQFSYESSSPGGIDDNKIVGYLPVLDKVTAADGTDQYSVVARLKSEKNSIRITSTAFRFKPQDFQNLELNLKVLHGVPGANPAKGGPGHDDSAFQIWFTLRNVKGLGDRSSYVPGGTAKVFGYYWADKDEQGKLVAPGTLFENYYSNKNFIVATLPEAWQIALEGGSESQGKWFDFKRNLYQDLKRAFPRENVDDMEIVAITIQTDSNDVSGETEAYFKNLKISAKP